MKDQIKRARVFFVEAEKGVRELDKDSRWQVNKTSLLFSSQNPSSLTSFFIYTRTLLSFNPRVHFPIILPQFFYQIVIKGANFWSFLFELEQHSSESIISRLRRYKFLYGQFSQSVVFPHFNHNAFHFIV